MNLSTEFRQILDRWGLEYFNRYYGTYRAIVEDNNDPEQLGRIKLRIPQIYGDQVHDYWAWGKGMYAGNKIGFFALPNKGDGVYICFEGGDPKYPIWEHGWWAEGEMMEDVKKNYPQVSLFQTTSGHKLLFDDKENIVRITSNQGHTVEINDYGISLDRGGNKVSLGALNGSDEPVVLGDKNGDQHKEGLEHMKAIVQKVITALGSVTPSNAGALAIAIVDLGTILPHIEITKVKIENTKSKNVTVDG